jgi:hypothetical protein
MAKDLNSSNLNVVSEAGDLKVVREADGQEARLGAVFLDGKRLDGVLLSLYSRNVGSLSEEETLLPGSGITNDKEA